MGIDDSYGIFNVVFFTFYPVFFCLLFVSCSYFCFDLSYQEFILDKLLIGISTRAVIWIGQLASSPGSKLFNQIRLGLFN